MDFRSSVSLLFSFWFGGLDFVHRGYMVMLCYSLAIFGSSFITRHDRLVSILVYGLLVSFLPFFPFPSFLFRVAAFSLESNRWPFVLPRSGVSPCL